MRGLLACLELGFQVWTAHAGDSRAVIASRESSVNNLTLDHKPNANDEYDRLIAAGGTHSLLVLASDSVFA